MRLDRWKLFLAGLVLLAVTSPLQAQKLAPGTWTGSAVGPTGETFPLTFVVGMSGDTTKITMDVAGEGTFDFMDLKVLEDRLTFYFMPGPVVTCVLMLADDKSYKGECADENGEAGIVEMIPPKKE